MEETKKRLYVEPDGFWTEAAILFMVMAIVFRLIGSIGRWDDLHYLITLVALPVFSGLLFLLCLLLFSKRAFWTTVIPVVFGVVFFIFLAMKVENEWIKVGSIALYVVIVVFYTMTFSHPKLKWVLAVILLAVFAAHVVLKDWPVLMDLENPVSFVDGMQEMSVLGIILSLLSVSFAMKMPKAAHKTEPQTGVEPEAPVEPEQPAPEVIPTPEPIPTPEVVPAVEEKAPAEEKKPAKEKRFGWGKKAAKEAKADEEAKPQEAAPAAAEAKPTGELPPAEIWSGQSVHAWEPPAPEEEPMPEETVIMPEDRAEPVQVLPMEDAEEFRDPPTDSGEREDA